MPDYSQGKIYKIINDIDDEFYIGSSVQKLYSRMCGHKDGARNDTKRRQSPINRKIREIGFEHFSIVLIELFPCNNKKELLRREQYWIDELKPCLNLFKSIEERPTYEVRKEQREKYKDKIVKNYKAYYEKNKEKIKERAREYGRNNKERIAQKNAEKVPCEYCGTLISRLHLRRHQRTMTCQYLRNQNL